MYYVLPVSTTWPETPKNCPAVAATHNLLGKHFLDKTETLSSRKTSGLRVERGVPPSSSILENPSRVLFYPEPHFNQLCIVRSGLNASVLLSIIISHKKPHPITCGAKLRAVFEPAGAASLKLKAVKKTLFLNFVYFGFPKNSQLEAVHAIYYPPPKIHFASLAKSPGLGFFHSFTFKGAMA